jgi:hypothetical protein
MQKVDGVYVHLFMFHYAAGSGERIEVAAIRRDLKAIV